MRSLNPQAELDEIKQALIALEAELQAAYRQVADTPPQMAQPGELAEILHYAIVQVHSMLGPDWPKPTVDQPEMDLLEYWMAEYSGCEATDGCWVEPDGECPHGHPSWFIRLGLI